MKLRMFVFGAVLVSAFAPAAFAQNVAASAREDYECGSGKLVVWTTQDYEEQHVVVWFLGSDGKQIHPSVTSPGRFVSLCSRGAFLLLDDTGAHNFTSPSWLMSAKGDLLGSRGMGEFIAKFAVTPDEAIVWAQSFEWDGKVSRTRLVVLAADGNLVHDKLYDVATQVTLRHAGKAYQVDVLKPDLPY